MSLIFDSPLPPERQAGKLKFNFSQLPPRKIEKTVETADIPKYCAPFNSSK